MITPADLITELERHDVRVSERQLTDWRSKDLLPPLTRRGLGQGRGTVQGWEDPEVIEQALAADMLLQRKELVRPALSDLWLAGYEIDTEIAKDARLAELRNTRLRIDRKAKAAGNLENLIARRSKKQPGNRSPISEFPKVTFRNFQPNF